MSEESKQRQDRLEQRIIALEAELRSTGEALGELAAPRQLELHSKSPSVMVKQEALEEQPVQTRPSKN